MKKLIFLLLLIPTTCFADEITAHINFTADTKYGSYGDSIILTKDDFTEQEWIAVENVLATKGIEEKKQARIDGWVAKMDVAVQPIEPTKEQLQARSADIEDRITDLQARKQEIEAKIAEMP